MHFKLIFLPAVIINVGNGKTREKDEGERGVLRLDLSISLFISVYFEFELLQGRTVLVVHRNSHFHRWTPWPLLRRHHLRNRLQVGPGSLRHTGFPPLSQKEAWLSTYKSLSSMSSLSWAFILVWKIRISCDNKKLAGRCYTLETEYGLWKDRGNVFLSRNLPENCL